MLRIKIGKFAMVWRTADKPRSGRWLLTLMLLLGTILYAAVPNIFKDGDTLTATQLNDNFNSLSARLDAMEGKSWRLIYETDVTSATTSINVTGLNGNTDIEYFFSFRIIGGGTGCTVMIRPNGDSAANYGYQRVTGTSTSASATRDPAFTGLPLATAQNSGELAAGSAIMWAKSGYARTLTSTATEGVNGTTVTNANVLASAWSNTGANITSFAIASGTNCIGVDSHIEIWARR